MKAQFIQNLKEIDPAYEDKKYLLTISGGKDSCAMAHLFHEFHLNFDIAHCNFHLRGTDSDRDQQFVENLAKEYQVKCFVKHFDTIKLQENSGKSVEMVAREIRYEWFNEIGKNYDYIVTAHHANDNAETILLNISRGTGLKGLTGIPIINGKIIRPLLSLTSDDIKHYLAENKLEFCEDYTNSETKYQRNKIRNIVIPELKNVNESIIYTLNKESKIWKKQFQFYEYQINTLIDKYLHKEKDHDFVEINEIENEPFKELLLYEILSQYHFSESCVLNICENLKHSSGNKYYSEDFQIFIERDKIIITKKDSNENYYKVYQSYEELNDDDFSIELIENKQNIKFEKKNNVAYFDAEKFKFPIEIRNWEAGDFFYPFGMKGKMKLSDFFNNNKIENYKKNNIKIMCSQKNITWVVGYRSDDRYKVDTQNTRFYYKITYKNCE